jgi:hypothetical protein
MPDVRSLRSSADDLRVDAVAQPPFCAEPSRASPQETFKEASRLGYDFLPVRDDDGVIRRVVATAVLRNSNGWDGVAAGMQVIETDSLVARDAPVFSLLDRFAVREVLFSLGRGGVDGVVTVYDLNQPAAHLFGFGLVLICEAELARVLRDRLGEDPSSAKARAERILGKRSMGVRRWQDARKRDKELHLASTLTFGEKLKLLPALGLTDLAARLGLNPDELMADLAEVKELRNALAHYDDEDRLADPKWVHSRMRLANALCRRLVDDRAD